MVQEACENPQAHASTSMIEISGEIKETYLEIMVKDKGCGFAPGSDVLSWAGELTLDRHFGLVGMKERADLIGASLKVESSLDLGSVIHINFEPEMA